jgi:predicted phage tail component-like protein
MVSHALLASNTLCDIQIIKSVFGNSLISSNTNVQDIIYQRIRRTNMLQLTANIMLTINTRRVLYVYPYVVSAVADIYGTGVAANYVITTDGILYPFGMYIMSDYRLDIMPSTKDYVETIPGRHGELDFGTDYAARAINLHGIIESNNAERTNALKRQMAQSLNPSMGNKTLIFADDYQKVHYVKYSGQIDLVQYPSGFEVTIPFKMNDPYIYATFTQTHIGDGVIVNNGNIACPMLITICGPANSTISIKINNQFIVFSHSILDGDILNVDTHNLTAYIGDNNVVGYVDGIDSKLIPGDNVVTIQGVDPAAVTITYRERWV